MTDTIDYSNLDVIDHTIHERTGGLNAQQVIDQSAFKDYLTYAIEDPNLPQWQGLTHFEGKGILKDYKELNSKTELTDEEADRRAYVNKVMAYANWNAKVNPNKQKEIESIVRNFGGRNYITADTLDAFISRLYEQQYAEVIDEYGRLPDHILTDPMFINNMDKNSYADFATERKVFENLAGKHSLFGTLGRHIDYATEMRNLELKVARQQITQEDALQEQDLIQYKYGRDDDNFTFKVLTQIVTDMANVLGDNVLNLATIAGTTFTAGAVTGAPAGPWAAVAAGAVPAVSAVGLGISSFFAYDTQQRAQGRAVLDAISEGSKKSTQQILDENLAYSVAEGGLELLGTVLGFKFAYSALVGASVAKGSRAARAGGSALETTLNQQQKISAIAKAATRDFSKSFLIEVGTEVAQAGIHQAGVNDVLDRDILYGMQDAMVGEAIDVAPAIAILSLIPGAGGALHKHFDIKNKERANKLRELADAFTQAGENTRAIATAETVAESDLGQRDPQTAGTLADTMIADLPDNRNVYIDAQELLEVFQEQGIDPSLLGEQFANVDELAAKGESITLTFGELVSMSSNDRHLISNVIRVRPDGVSNREVARLTKEALTEWRDIAALEAQSEQARDRANQELQEHDDFVNSYTKNLVDTNVANSVKEANEMSEIMYAFVKGMSDLTGLSFQETIQSIPPLQISREQGTLFGQSELTGNGQVGGFDPATNRIVLSQNATIDTTLHEVTHYFINTLQGMTNKGHARIDETFGLFEDAMGIERGKWNTLSPDEQAKVHEKFTHSFLGYIMSGEIPMATNDTGRVIRDQAFRRTFANIKTMLRRAFANKYRNLIQGYRDAGFTNDQAYQQAIADVYYEVYDDNIDMGSKELTDVMQRLFVAKRNVDMLESDYPIIDIIDRLNDHNVTDSDLQDIRDAYNEGMREVQDVEDKALVQTSETVVRNSKKLQKILDHFTDWNREGKATIKALFAKHDRIRQAFNDKYAKIWEKMKQSKAYREYYDTLNNLKYLGVDPSSAKAILQRKDYVKLQQMGIIREGGASVDFLFDLMLKDRYSTQPLQGMNRVAVTSRMLTDMARQPTPRQLAMRQAINETINRPFGEAFVEGDLERANTAIVSVRQKVVSKVMNLLHKLQGTVKLSLDNIKEIVAREQANIPLANLARNSYLANAKRARRRATAAVAKKDYSTAAKQLAIEFANLERSKQAHAQVTAIKKNLKKLQDFFGKPDSKLGGKYHIDVINLGRTILYQIGLGKPIEPGVIQQLKSVMPDKADLIDNIVSMAPNLHYENLTVSQANTVIELLKYIKQLGLNERTMLVNGVRINQDTIVTDMISEMGHLSDRGGSRVTTEGGQDVASFTRSKSSKIRDGVFDFIRTWIGKTYDVCARRGDTWVKYVYQPVRNAMDKFVEHKTDIVQRRDALLKGMQWREGDIVCTELIDARTGLPFALGKNGMEGKAHIELFGLYLHLGNESNFTKLLDGYGWTREQFQAFHERMIAEGWVDKTFMDTLQGMWDLYADIYTVADNAHFELKGYRMQRVKDRTISTPWGNYKGGYVPAKTNADMTNVGKEPLELDNTNLMLRDVPLAPNGFTKVRDENYRQPLTTNPEFLLGQMESVLKFAYMQPAVSKVNALFRNKRLQEELKRRDPELYDKVILPWLVRSANLSTTTPIKKAPWFGMFLNKFRNLTGMSILCGNISNAMQQFTGISAARVLVKGKYLTHAMSELIGSPRQTTETIMNMSPFMKARLKSNTIVLSESINKLLIDPSFFRKAQNFNTDHAYFLQKAVQNQVDKVTWLGAYEQAIKNGKTNEEAIKLADTAVIRTQGSFDAIDLNNLEASNPFAKLVTQFGSYFYTMGNLIYTEAVRAKLDTKGFERTKRLAVISMYGFIIPAIVSDAIVKTLGGEWWDDETEPGSLLLDNLVGSQVRTAAGMMPFVGAGINTAWNKMVNDKSFITDNVFFNLPVVTTTQAGFQGIGNIVKAPINDEEITHRDIRNTFGLLSIMMGMPMGRYAGNVVSYQYGVATGDYDPDNSILYLWESLTGKATATTKQ